MLDMVSHCRRSRKAEEYRELTENINDALYGLVILRARNEQLLQGHKQGDINSNLEKGIKLIDELLKVHKDPLSGSLMKQKLLEESNVSLESLQETRVILEALQENHKISFQESLEDGSADVEQIAEDTLEELDQTVVSEFKNKYQQKWSF